MALASVFVGLRLLTAHPSGWEEQHAGWFALTLAALVLAAYQWPTGLFRGFALLCLIGGIGLLALIGRDVVLAERGAEARTALTTVDRQLAELTQLNAGALTAAQELADKANSDLAALPEDDPDLAEAKEAADAAADKLAAAQVRNAKRSDMAESAQDAITAACTLANTKTDAQEQDDNTDLAPVAPEGAEACTTTKPGPLRDPSATRTAVTLAELRTAELADDIADDEASAKALVAAQAEHAAAEVAQAQQDVDGVSVVDAVAAGAESLVALVTNPGRAAPTSVPWQQTALTWVVILLVLTAIYRRLEILNAGLVPGPVAFDAGDGKDQQLAKIRTVLLQNFSEPGPQPGAKATESITDLTSIDERGGKIAKAILGVVNATAFPARGYEIKATIRENPDESPSLVLLTINSRRTGATLHVVPESGSDPALTAALRAAAWILARARGVPPWLQVPPDSTSRSPIATTNTATPAERMDVGDDNQPKWLVRDLGAPADVLVKRGNACDLSQNPAAASLYYALALDQWPDYTIARYRLAASLAATHATPQQQNWVNKLVKIPANTLARSVLPLRLGNKPLEQEDFYEAARDHLAFVRRAALVLPIRRLSIRERAATARFLDWKRTLQLVDTAQQVLDARQEKAEKIKELAEKKAKKATPSRDASVAYNEACIWAVRAIVPSPAEAKGPQEYCQRRASLHLAHALTSPSAGRISLEWVIVDPDLEGLRQADVWTALSDQFGLKSSAAPTPGPAEPKRRRGQRLRRWCGRVCGESAS